jgi:prepilin-type N-terminal cleavage/methylation domain-containing protein
MFARRQQGFTLIELVVVIIIISGLLYFAFERLLKLEVQAERASMQLVIGNINSAIGLVISQHIADDDIPGLRKYVDSNPMALLAQTPPQYLGSFAGPPPKLPKGVHWYYDQTRHSLVYVTGSPRYFQSDGPKKNVTELKILPVYDDNNANGRFDAGDTLVGLKLAATAPYHWYNEPIQPADYATAAAH